MLSSDVVVDVLMVNNVYPKGKAYLTIKISAIMVEVDYERVDEKDNSVHQNLVNYYLLIGLVDNFVVVVSELLKDD